MQPPRRWSDSVGGIIWLPRLIDKARAYDAASLGVYLFGQSPIDTSFLRAAGINYQTFLKITRAACDDVEVLADLERRAPGAAARLRAWSANPSLLCRATFVLVDADEGYGNGALRLISFVPQGVFHAMVTILRCAFPLRTDEIR